jgi:hypothetical protein
MHAVIRYIYTTKKVAKKLRQNVYLASERERKRDKSKHTLLSSRSSPRSLNRFIQPHDSQALAAPQLAAHKPRRRNQRVVPVSEHGFHVARDALHDDRSDGHEGAVFFRDGEDSVFLREDEGGGEGVGLRSREGTDDTGFLVLAICRKTSNVRCNDKKERLTCTSRRTHPARRCVPAPGPADKRA